MFQAMRHQARVIPAIIGGDNLLLVWEPGAGKTYPALAAIQWRGGKALCVVPAHLREQWLSAAKKHVPLLDAVILDETLVKIPDETFRDNDIFIVSYEYASTVARWKQLRKTHWRTLVIDEAHYLANLDADRTRAILGKDPLNEDNGLVFAADTVCCLTGTPFTFPNQIYPHLAALFPDALIRPERNGPGMMTAREWENEFCVVAPGKGGFGEKVVDAKNIPELRTRLAPFLDKVKLEDAFDMRGLTVDEIPIRANLRDLTRGLDRDVLEKYQALMEILSDDDIPDQEKLSALEENGLVMAQVRHHIAVTKIQPTVEIIRNEIKSGVDKLIVFGWHREPLRALAKELKAPVYYGDATKAQKRAALEQFLDDEKTTVLAGQITSMGTGTDGLQAVCRRSLFMETSWSFRENKQCLHRTYRGGQTRPCHSSFITLVGSVDEYVSRIVKRNAEIIRKVLD